MGTYARVLLAIAVTCGSTLASGDGLAILTFPTGLVAGKIPVRVELGAGALSAELYLDGERACTVIASMPECTVDLGNDPHVHLLELVRFDGAGQVVDRVERWVNRPGTEAELSLQIRQQGRECGALMSWAHPRQLDPVELEVTLSGEVVDVEGRLVRFECADPDQPQVLVASAIFPDGRRAEAVAVAGGFAGTAVTDLTAVPLVADAEMGCESPSPWSDQATRTERGDFEVVFVLDPSAGYIPLYRSGWYGGISSPNLSGTAKTFDQILQPGGREPRARPSWRRAEASVFDAERLWFVTPDSRLSRVNGFGAGRGHWLHLLFRYGTVELKEKPRIADAVAASGLVAAAGPRRRAVALILGNKAAKDGSRFTPDQARAFLAEVGVPLVVLRNGKVRDDGWPQGLLARNMESFADGLEALKGVIELQCVAWFGGRRHPSELVAALRPGVRVAGQGPEVALAAESVWRSMKAEAATGEPPAEETAGASAWATGRLDLTAVSVLISVSDSDGRPVTDLGIEELEVEEDAEAVTVLELERVLTGEPGTVTEPATGIAGEPDQEVSKPVPVTVYVDRVLSDRLGLREAVDGLRQEAARLVALGPVEVAVADDRVEAVLEGTREAQRLDQVLDEVARYPATSAIEHIRKRFIRDVRALPDRFSSEEAGGLAEGGGMMRHDFARIKAAALAAAAEESLVIGQRLRMLREWMFRRPELEPGVMFAVGMRFDERPADFYTPFVEKFEPDSAAELRERMEGVRRARQVADVGQELAASGWRVYTVAGHNTATSGIAAEMSGGNRFQAMMSTGTEVVRVTDPGWLFVDPIGPQRHLAAPSGGGVAVGSAEVARVLDRAQGWYRLTYQVERPPDGREHALAVRALRQGVEVQQPTVVVSETLEQQAEARLHQLLDGATAPGELPVTVAHGPVGPVDDETVTCELEVSVDLGQLQEMIASRGGASLRVSVAVEVVDREPFVIHRQELLPSSSSAGWVYVVPLRWPAAQGLLAVTVEELASGLWGGTAMELPR